MHSSKHLVESMALVRTNEDVGRITLASRELLLDPRRNSFPPVSLLPAEILADIFIHNARNSYVHETCRRHHPAAPSWVNVSYVCSHWRDIALDCQTLWTYIPTTSQRWTQELLARSQKAQLKICTVLSFEFVCTDRLPQVLSIVEQLVNHSRRIQLLRLDFASIDEEYHYQILSKFLSSCLPCLQRLEVSNFDLSEGEPSLHFEGNTPALRKLALKYCWMSWQSLELSALTTLHLHSAEHPFPDDITMAGFLAMLRRMPHLVHLSVHNSLPSALDFLSSGEFNATPVINLSRLSDMSIRAPISTVNALLSCVDIPLTTKVKLGCASENSYTTNTMDGFTRLATLLAQRINPPHDGTPAVLKFYSMAIGDKATLAFSTSEHGCSSTSSLFSHGSDKNIRLLVYFLLDVAIDTPSLISSHMCRTIPLTGIQSVHFVGPTPLLDFWRNMLASFPNVRRIKLTGCYMPNIASMLSIPPLPSHNCWEDEDGPVDEDQNDIFVPALQELELYKITFSRVDSHSDLDTLCEAISTRKETQCGLTLKECRMDSREGFEALELVGRWKDTQFGVTRL